jgi:hypothetical protein
MLIVSKFRDYYDSVSSFGIDKSVVYNRHDSYIEMRRHPFCKHEIINGRYFKHSEQILSIFSYDLRSSRWQDKLELKPYHIFFCGKLYIVYKKIDNYDGRTRTEIIYKEEDLFKVLEDKKIKLSKDRLKQISNMYLSFNEKDCIFANIDYKSPCLMYDFNKEKLLINPCLSEFEFYRVVDSASAFQSIQSFISGVMGVEEKPMIEIKEKDKIVSKGFNKWSFRNPDPPKRKMK